MRVKTIFFVALLGLLSVGASAQFGSIPNSAGTWSQMTQGWWPGEPACTAGKGVPMQYPHYETVRTTPGVTYCYVLNAGQPCAAGYTWNQETFACEGAPPPICVPPDVDLGNGECGLPQCGDGYITQGHINGQPICQLDCTPYGGGSPGFFNGVEGCYGGDGPSCPAGTFWGQVNGVSGCWGDGSGGDGGSGSSSGGDGGSGSSSGGDGGSGSSSGGDGGNNGGGNGYEGAPYDPSVPCPAGYDKTANNTCEGQGDCYPGYRSVVISQSPFYAMCMPNDPPPSSSSSSASSVSSTPSSASSSASSTPPIGGGSSSGNASSSGSGSGGGGSGDGDEEGDCETCGEGKGFTLEGPTVREAFQTFVTGVQQTAVVTSVSGFLTLPPSSGCPVWHVSVWVFDITIDQFCSPSIPWFAISGIILFVASIVAFRVAFTNGS